eukprot:scaffold54852_cov57-Phaeocystis_antarctica.AAC.1
MCDYRPRVPKEFPKAKWVTIGQLISRLRKHAPAELFDAATDDLGRPPRRAPKGQAQPEGFRQLIIAWLGLGLRLALGQLIVEWLKDHSAFAGLPYSAWCKRLKDNSPEAHSRSLAFRFSRKYVQGVSRVLHDSHATQFRDAGFAFEYMRHTPAPSTTTTKPCNHGASGRSDLS